MKFIFKALEGRSGFFPFLSVFLFSTVTLIGLGQIPYALVLKNKGFDFEEQTFLSVVEAQEILGNQLFFILQLMPFVVGLIALLIAVPWIMKRKAISIFTSRSSLDLKRVGFAFLCWFAFMLLLFSVSYLIQPENIQWNFKPSTIIGLILISIFIVPLQTTFEEVIFRGLLFQGIGLMTRNGILTISITGLLFGLIHAGNPEIAVLGKGILLYYVVSGLFLGLITYLDEGLELSMGFHAANNIFGALILTNNWQAFQTDALFIDLSPPSVGLDVLFIPSLGYPLLLLIFSKKYSWNWKALNKK
jgi:membrane protease YdiL (CAAX protease family)